VRIFLFLVFLLYQGSIVAQQKHTRSVVRGFVYDSERKPLLFATVRIEDLDLSTATNDKGAFMLQLPLALSTLKEPLQLTVSHIGKETQLVQLTSSLSAALVIVLKDRSLALPEVEFAAKRNSTRNSNSSIIFNRDAIEQSQALSIADVLQYLPGKTVTPPNVMDKMNITLRSVAEGTHQLNNAFGTSLVLDGTAISNNANIQAVNIARNGVGSTGQIGIGGNRTSNTNDFANNGIDLRQLSVESIESIEVISGVASARYGDFTDGAIIINRQAGVSPLRVGVRVRQSTYNVSVSKGLSLGKWGSLNLGGDYLSSQEDPRDKLKSYERVNGSIAWTIGGGKRNRFKNTLSLDANTNFDQLRRDPDDGDQSAARFKNSSFRFNNRFSLNLRNFFIDQVSASVSYDWGRQESYDQVYLNTTTIRQLTQAMETGINEGYFVPGFYLATRHLIGTPVNGSARLDLTKQFHTGKLLHSVVLGGNIQYSGNKGPGLLIDPERPRFSSTDGIMNRPNTYQRNLYTQTYGGAYLEDRITTRLFKRELSASLGLRADMQNGFFLLSPRLSSSYALSKKWKFKLAYGRATKAPSILQVNPGDVYYDIPLVSYYTNNPAENYYLAYTEVIRVQNLALKPYSSNSVETGFSYDGKLASFSAFFFQKENKDGFTTVSDLRTRTLPVYSVTPNPGQKPTVQPNGQTKEYVVRYNRMTNGLYSRNRGAELVVQTKKIAAIQTSVSFNTSWYTSYFYNNNPNFGTLDSDNLSENAVVGIYEKDESTSTTVKSGFVTTTHIPKLRLAVMLSGDWFWYDRTRYDEESQYPIAYLDRSMKYVALTKEEGRSTAYQHLWRSEEDRYFNSKIPYLYGNMHLRLTKEIGNSMRFSFNAYNFLYFRETARKQETTTTGSTAFRYYTLRTPPSFGAELLITIK
jgi:outer membrane receptor for ferrienterochelin and colicin